MNQQIESNKIIPKKINFAACGGASPEANDIQKGEIADMFRYNGNIKIKKSGKDIKTAMAAVKVKEEAKRDALKVQLDEAKEKCTIAPFEKASDYRFRGFKDCCTDVMFFPWECAWFNDNQSGMAEYGVGQKDPYEGKRPTTKEEAACNQAYNRLADQYLEACVDIAMTDMYVRNLEDKTQYELTTEQAIALGF